MITPGTAQKMLTVKQVAEYLDLNVGTVYQAVQRKELKAYRFGKQYRIAPVDLERYMNPERKK
ncbi:helix-turn-helix domain-containing protein [Actinotignum schaalii]|uniref:helix-turn-helix domain-containing protein n=1 Tax=Actinotignum TaxID=1653174 RepID=UPI00237D8043|nr:helix-turn-helix domain-containing protein [Actinotignum sanguinis]MDE1552251.1 helix-turn-helix domain-containing protein [Actinotignum sanguinis]